MRRIIRLLMVCLGLGAISQNMAQPLEQQQRAELLDFSGRSSVHFQQEQAEVQRKAERMGIPIRRVMKDGRIIHLRRFDHGIPRYYGTNNLVSAQTISTTALWSGGISGLSLSGRDVTLGIWDGGGTRTTHRELSGRVVQKDNPESLSDHATHVSGTMIGKGLSSDARGMAHDASLNAYDYLNDLAEMAIEAANGLMISNHSYGELSGWDYAELDSGKIEWFWFGNSSISQTEDYGFGSYSTESARLDSLTWFAPYYLSVHSSGNDRGEGPDVQPIAHWEYVNSEAVWVSDYRPLDGGNTGYDCLPTDKTAKNTLTVGAIWDIPGGYHTVEDVMMSSFSSWGPTDDGRIKPDLTANGTGLFSSIASNDQAYGYFTGTSMACPSVTGSIALLLEHQQKLHPGIKLLASTLKALLIHTADEAGAYPGPDYQFGWGLMNSYNAARLMSQDAQADPQYDISEQSIAVAGNYEYTFSCQSCDYVKATICWTDVPGDPPALSLDPSTSNLVNDLDLKITGPGSVSYYPWKLDPANPSAAATQGVNSRDNVEQILIENPPDGNYTLRISPNGAITAGPQAVSLILSIPQKRIALSFPEDGSDLMPFSFPLSWEPFGSVKRYRVQVSTDPNFASLFRDQDYISATSLDLTGLQPTQTYYWRVNSVVSGIPGSWSDIWSFTTGAALTDAGYTLRFDGRDDYVEIPVHEKYYPIEDNDIMTIEAWINISNFDNQIFPIVDCYMSNMDFGWSFFLIQNEGLELNLLYSSRKAVYNFEKNRWYHVAVACDKSQNLIRFMVNGETVLEETFQDDIPDTHQFNSPWLVGANWSGGDEYSCGSIDELRIWSVARTRQQIADGMKTRLTGTPAGLIGNFNMNAGAGQTMAEASGNVTAGILHNGPTWIVSTAPIGTIPALNLTTTTLKSGTFNQTYADTLKATGGILPYRWNVAAGTLPLGTTLDSLTGRIGGIPQIHGSFPITVRVTDAQIPAVSADKNLQITIQSIPVSIPTTQLRSGKMYAAYADTLQGNGGILPYRWSIQSGTLPSGLSLDSLSGIISGIPGVSGTVSITFRITDSQNPAVSGTKTLSLKIEAAAIAIATNQLRDGQVGTAYADTLESTGGTPPYQYSLLSGSLPTGLQLKATSGILSGTPEAYGDFSFTVEVGDASNPRKQASKTLSVTIYPAKLAIVTDSLRSVSIDDEYTDTIQVSGGMPPYRWSIINGSLPDGLLLDSLTGIVAGIVTAQGSAVFTVRVEDSQNPPDTVSREFRMMSLTDITESDRLSKETCLMTNYPNPFNPVTTIGFNLAQTDQVLIEIYDIRGVRIRRLVDRSYPAGYNTINWDGRDDRQQNAVTGVYFIRMKAGDRIDVEKVMLLK
ncbi:MAG: S8 family serine peptidase [Candidatus Delongbacteria bacterium]|nr:S8 family serine peptidase [Candidatus Delongbacteria bacterium]